MSQLLTPCKSLYAQKRCTRSLRRLAHKPPCFYVVKDPTCTSKRHQNSYLQPSHVALHVFCTKITCKLATRLSVTSHHRKFVRQVAQQTHTMAAPMPQLYSMFPGYATWLHMQHLAINKRQKYEGKGWLKRHSGIKGEGTAKKEEKRRVSATVLVRKCEEERKQFSFPFYFCYFCFGSERVFVES